VGPVEFYQQARKWFEEGDLSDSATARSIVSRAYYAAFLVARNAAGIDEDDVDQTKEVHRKVHEFYLAKDAIFANELQNLKRARVFADYKMGKPCVRKDADAALKRSRSLIAKFVKPPPPLPVQAR